MTVITFSNLKGFLFFFSLSKMHVSSLHKTIKMNTFTCTLLGFVMSPHTSVSICCISISCFRRLKRTLNSSFLQLPRSHNYAFLSPRILFPPVSVRPSQLMGWLYFHLVIDVSTRNPIGANSHSGRGQGDVNVQ